MPEEILKTAVLVLAIFIPIIGVYFQFRRELVKSTNPRPSVGMGGMVAIGGALASEGGVMMHVQAMEKQSQSLDLQTDALGRLADATFKMAQAHTTRAELGHKMLDEAIEGRRTLSEISDLIKRRNRLEEDRNKGQ